MNVFRASSDETISWIQTSAQLLVAIPLVSYLLAVLSLWIGFSVNGFIFPAAVCLSVLWVCTEKNMQRRVKWSSVLTVVGVLLVTILISMYVYDWSYDGQWYHICTVRELVNGWNPLWDTSVSSSVDRDTAMWVEHYPRGIETIVATVVAFLGNLDAGKVLNMWFVISSMGYVYIFLHDFLPNRNRYMRLWITVLIALNPVVIVQLFTCYIDWTLYTLLVIFLVNLYLFFEKGERRALYVDLLLLFFISSIKFNIFFWIVLWGGILFFILLRNHKYKQPCRLTVICAVIALAGIVIGGYNPYVTNWQEHGSPFYPLAGDEKVDIFNNQVLPMMQGKSNFENVLLSLVANPSNNMNSDEVSVVGISKNNLSASWVSDARIGGFGIFFFESVLLALILFISTGYSRRMAWYLVALVGLLASLFILPYGYWARYVSFFYLFPFVLLFYAERYGLKRRLSRGVHILILTLLSIDVFISLSGVIVQNVVYRQTVDYVLNRMEASTQEVELSTCNYLFLDKMERRGIPYKLVSEETLKDRLDISNPIYLNREDFDFETNRPRILSIYSSFGLRCEPNEHYTGNAK